jgi:hypothetical protein
MNSKIWAHFNKIIQNRYQIGIIFAIGMWVLFNYLMGNRFYAILILPFFLILAIIRRPFYPLVAIAVIVIVLLNTPSLDSWTDAVRSNLTAVEHPGQTIRNLFFPNTGVQLALPREAQQTLQMLTKHQLTSFTLSDKILQDQLVWQPIVESSWPIKMETSSPNLFILIEEVNDYPTCTIIDTEKEVALESCR